MKASCVICGNEVHPKTVRIIMKDLPRAAFKDIPWLCSEKCVRVYENRFNIQLRKKGE